MSLYFNIDWSVHTMRISPFSTKIHLILTSIPFKNQGTDIYRKQSKTDFTDCWYKKKWQARPLHCMQHGNQLHCSVTKLSLKILAFAIHGSLSVKRTTPISIVSLWLPIGRQHGFFLLPGWWTTYSLQTAQGTVPVSDNTPDFTKRTESFRPHRAPDWFTEDCSWHTTAEVQASHPQKCSSLHQWELEVWHQTRWGPI